MILPNITEINLIGVFDRGIPNKERIAMRPNVQVDLGQYGIMIGVMQPNGMATPLNDNIFWFGDGILSPPQWLFVYTGTGKITTGLTDVTKEPAVAVYWNRREVLFANQQLVPILIKVGDVLIGNPGA